MNEYDNPNIPRRWIARRAHDGRRYHWCVECLIRNGPEVISGAKIDVPDEDTGKAFAKHLNAAYREGLTDGHLMGRRYKPGDGYPTSYGWREETDRD